MALDPDNPSSHLLLRQGRARERARGARHVTSEMWEVLNSTWLEMQHINEERLAGDGALAFFDWVKERSHLFRGVTFGTALRTRPSISPASARSWSAPTTPRASST